MPFFDQLAHVAVEESEQEDLDMRAVDVGIRHDDDLAVAEFCGIEGIADAAAERLDDRGQRLVAVDLFNARFFDVEHLAAQGQDRLETAVSAVLGGAACRIALDQIQLGKRSVLALTVGKFAGERGMFGLFPRRFPRFARRLARDRRRQDLVDDHARVGGIFFKKFLKFFGHDAADQRAHLRVAEFCFGLALKLRVGELDADDRAKPLGDVLLRERGIVWLLQIEFLCVFVDAAEHRGAEALDVRTAVDRAHVVGEGHEVFVVAVVVLHRHFGHDVVFTAADVDDLGMHRRERVALVDILDVGADTALVAEIVLADRVGAQVAQDDADARVEERLLAHTL